MSHRSSAAINAGRKLFIAQKCGDCHGLATVGAPASTGPNFDTSEKLTLGQLRSALTEGSNGMPSYARLRPAELSALAEFLYSATHRAEAK